MTQTNTIENDREKHVHNLLCLLRSVYGIKEALFFNECMTAYVPNSLASYTDLTETLEDYLRVMQNQYPLYFMRAGVEEPEGITEDNLVLEECIKEVETLFLKLPLSGSKPGKWEWVPYD